MEGGKLKLGYWGIRGLAERIRMLLEYTGLPYEEVKYTGETAQQWFGHDKPEYAKKNPAINLPFLTDGDKVIAESEAIMIYIAYRSGKPELVGRNQD
jgi:glutathione S-transferase